MNFVRLVVATLGLACALSPSATVGAQDRYPSKPIHLVVPFAAGGATDIVARLVAAKMGNALGQQIVVDNHGGSRGSIGADIVAKSLPDGYTLLSGTSTTHVINPARYKRLPYDSVRDFEPISLLVMVPSVLVVHPDVDARTVKQLIALARANPGKYGYASSGDGTSLHLAGALFARMADVDIQHIPFRGSGAALTELISGQVSMMFDLLPSVLPNIKSGSVRPLAVTVKQRLQTLPDVPTMSEAGLPGYETYTWNALFAPAKTPKAIIDRLNAESVKAVKLPEIRQKLAELSADVVGSTPEELAAHVKAELAKWTPVVKATGAMID
ncbi:MAG: tripartite tricarboxylate transporter substrate binding protein [Proteobacteria bacterium]|nr:tripartite tricarboxylate transporter substrate binding protein [Pseudomonadota bacterium]